MHLVASCYFQSIKCFSHQPHLSLLSQKLHFALSLLFTQEFKSPKIEQILPSCNLPHLSVNLLSPLQLSAPSEPLIECHFDNTVIMLCAYLVIQLLTQLISVKNYEHMNQVLLLYLLLSVKLNM